MHIETKIVDGPAQAVHRVDCQSCEAPGAGAQLTFQGIVRAVEDGRSLAAIEYETYDPMAETVLDQLARGVAEEFDLVAITVVHSRGFVPVGACSLVVAIAAEHRQAALEGMAAFIDRLKSDAPIWKYPVWGES